MNAFPNFRRSLCLLPVLVMPMLKVQAQATAPELKLPFETFSSNGATPFAKALFTDDPEQMREFAKVLDGLMTKCGTFESYEVLSRHALSQRVERLILVIYFERRPIWLKLDYYRASAHSRFISWKASLVPSDILPADVLSQTG